VQTNILFTDIAHDIAEPLLDYLAAQGIKLTSSNYTKADQLYKRVRWVTHLDISGADIQRTLQVIQKFQR
jgi:threonine aldolase